MEGKSFEIRFTPCFHEIFFQIYKISYLHSCRHFEIMYMVLQLHQILSGQHIERISFSCFSQQYYQKRVLF